ncbi:hypothetical protein TorRG33x02_012000 [Trema orientale]|uniref:Uncharacterized protein n=1 Tax=Trema orientale TaxID=63057 RepID=A0A2P5FZF4_TREOI|nr:hypothetical protein TorRG33x02_012000 [Trema orientale]
MGDSEAFQGPRPIFCGNTAEIISTHDEVKSKSTLVDNDAIECAAPFYHRWSRRETFKYWSAMTPRWQ